MIVRTFLLAPLALGMVLASPLVDENCLGENVNSQELSDPVNEASKLLLNDAERAFAVNLIKSLFNKFNNSGINENIFISPASVYQTLLLAYMGSRGQTEQELQSLVTFNHTDISRSDIIKNYLFERAFQAIRDQDPDIGYTLTHANKFFFDRSLVLNQCLQLVLKDEMEAVDFNNAEKARTHINQWVKEKTHKKIEELLPPGAVDGSTSVALVNAAYFKGEWQSKFEKADTKTNNFYVRRDKISKTKFMEQKGKFNYYTSEELRAHVLEMPYIGEDVSMIVILPPFEDNSLFDTVARLTPATLTGVMAEVRSGFYSVDDLTVKLPRFRVEQSFQLSEVLGNLGLTSLFGSSDSDLSGFLSPEAKEQSVDLSSAIHKSFIEVNEEGSEAAAATALFGFRSARPLFHTEFIADHPFLFMIYDKPTDTVLFFGVFQDPNL